MSFDEDQDSRHRLCLQVSDEPAAGVQMTDSRALALKAAEIGIMDDDPASGTVYWSPTLYRILGAELGTRPSLAAYLDLVHPKDRAAVHKMIAGAKKSSGDEIFTCEHRIVRACGQMRWFSLHIHPYHADPGAGRESRLVSTVIDISTWKAKEQEAQNSQARLSAILSIAPSAIISIDAKQRITLFNESAERLFGYTHAEIVGQPLELLIPERFRRTHRGHVDGFWAGPQNYRRMGERQSVAGLRKDGSEFPAEASISKTEIGGERIFTVVLQDITERKQAAEQLSNMNRTLERRVAERTRELEEALGKREEAQKQLIQSQRMEAFGQLTGGIAHDFNNLLAIVSGSLELLEPAVTDERAREHLERATNAASMGARLTSRLLTFARRRRLEPTLLSLNDQVKGLLELLQRTLGEQIILKTSLAPHLGLAIADPSEAENAILNFSLNARDAMPHGGRLIIETANFTLGESEAATVKGLKAGDFIRLSISDTGTGIAPDLLEKVFEPFFTTKATGRGTGLGLSTIYGFATQSGGTVTIYSEAGKGTTVHLYLPRAEAKAESAAATATRGSAILFSRNNETVLVVEDNPDVRETTLQRVEGLGYVVEEAPNGPQAITILGKRPDIALVFSDVVMAGGMSGYDVGRWVKEHKPEIKVLLTSGFAPEIAQTWQEGEFQVLRKPFSRAELARALSDTLYGPEERLI
jgi:PAS domain S-box-containing protein